MSEHPAVLAGQALSVAWRVRHQTLFLYEVDLDAILELVPQRLSPRELRPGIGMCAIETLDYLPGHFGDTTGSFEIVFSVMVEPDLRLAMPVPQMSLYVASVLSSSAAFVEHEQELLRMPMTHHAGLAMAFSPDGASVEVADRGEQIVRCHNTGGAPVFVPKVNWGLIYTQQRGELHQGAFRWEGEVFEHQRRGDHGGLAAHPFFGGLSPRAIRACYRQMASNPAVTAHIGYYHFGKI